MRHRFYEIVFSVFGHRLCCPRIPEWTAHVGRPWQPAGEGGWNLYNALWSAAERFRRGLERPAGC